MVHLDPCAQQALVILCHMIIGLYQLLHCLFFCSCEINNWFLNFYLSCVGSFLVNINLSWLMITWLCYLFFSWYCWIYSESLQQPPSLEILHDIMYFLGKLVKDMSHTGKFQIKNAKIMKSLLIFWFHQK